MYDHPNWYWSVPFDHLQEQFPQEHHQPTKREVKPASNGKSLSNRKNRRLSGLHPSRGRHHIKYENDLQCSSGPVLFFSGGLTLGNWTDLNSVSH